MTTMFERMAAEQSRFHEETLHSSMAEKWDDMAVLFRMFGPDAWKNDAYVPNAVLAMLGVEPGEDGAGAFRRIFGKIPYADANPARPTSQI